MTPEQLQAIRARLDAATPGNTAAEIFDHAVFIKASEQEATLIAHAPTDLRALLDEVERLKAENIKQFRQGAELMQSAILYILHDYNIDPQAIADIVQMDYPVRPEDWAKRPRSET